MSRGTASARTVRKQTTHKTRRLHVRAGVNFALTCFPFYPLRQYSYAGVLHACMHLRDFEMSMALLEEMEKNGMPANAEGYATAIRTCARSGRTEEAVFLYAQSLRLSIVPTKVWLLLA